MARVTLWDLDSGATVYNMQHISRAEILIFTHAYVKYYFSSLSLSLSLSLSPTLTLGKISAFLSLRLSLNDSNVKEGL